MKKAAVLSMAAFYLLLTTGVYVCIVHCAVENLAGKSVMSMSYNNAHKHCKKDKDCNCCKKHGSYVIKENIKPGSDFQISLAALTIYYTELPDLIYLPDYQHHISWNDTNAPPGKSGKVISIQFRSLQI